MSVVLRHGTDHGVRELPQPVPCALRCYRVTLWCYHDLCRGVAAGAVVAPESAKPTLKLELVKGGKR